MTPLKALLFLSVLSTGCAAIVRGTEPSGHDGPGYGAGGGSSGPWPKAEAIKHCLAGEISSLDSYCASWALQTDARGDHAVIRALLTRGCYTRSGMCGGLGDYHTIERLNPDWLAERYEDSCRRRLVQGSRGAWPDCDDALRKSRNAMTRLRTFETLCALDSSRCAEREAALRAAPPAERSCAIDARQCLGMAESLEQVGALDRAVAIAEQACLADGRLVEAAEAPEIPSCDAYVRIALELRARR